MTRSRHPDRSQQVVTGTTGGLMQDDNRKLFRWFASRIGAWETLRRVLSGLR